MSKWTFFLPFIGLIFFVGVFAFRLGVAWTSITEAQIIERYAAQYMREAGQGAEARHCLAIPVEHAKAVLEVICRDTQGVRYVYGANQRGRLIYQFKDDESAL